MSKYSDKKMRQRLELIASEKRHEMEKASKELEEKEKIRKELERQKAKNDEIVRTAHELLIVRSCLENAINMLDVAMLIKGIAKRTKGSKSVKYESAKGIIVASRNKLASALARVK